MSTNNIIQICLAAIGILNYLLVAIILFTTKKGNIRANKILGILLIAVCLKLSFAFLANIKYDWGISGKIINILSISAYLSFGPLLYIYYKLLYHKKIKILNTLLLFIPVCAPFFKPLYNFRFPMWFAQLYFALFLLSVFFQLWTYYKSKSETGNFETQKKWAYIFLLSFSLIWLSATLLIIDFNYYFIELLVFIVLFFYIDIYLAVKYYWLKKGGQREDATIKSLKLGEEEETVIINGLNTLMEKEKIYIDPELNLPYVASRLNVKVYKLSHVINQCLNMTFNEYVNSYRIADVKNALIMPENKNLKIACIAFDFGFNSISVFNYAFKKLTNYTPSQYRKEFIVENKN